MNKSSSTTKTKISKLLLKPQQVKKVSVSSNKSSKYYISNNRSTKAIVKSITTYKVDPYLFQRQSSHREKMNSTDNRDAIVNEVKELPINNDELTAAPVPTFVTKENEMQINVVVVESDREVGASSTLAKHDLAINDKYQSTDLMMKGGDEVIPLVIDDSDDKESTNKPPVAQPYVNYHQFGDSKKLIQKSVVDADDHEMNRIFLINAIKKPAGDDSDEEMSPSHSFVINKSLVAATATADNSSKKSFFVMHNNGTNDDDDREKENYHDNVNPQLLPIKKSPYELTQNNFKSMNLNLSPVTVARLKKSTNFNNNGNGTKTHKPPVICPKLLKTSLGSGATNVTGLMVTTNNSIQMSPIRRHSEKGSVTTLTTIDREAAREFIKKQQEQRKKMEIERKSNKEKELIKQRLEALRKRTRNLVQHNVEKKRVGKKGNVEMEPVKGKIRQKEGNFLCKYFLLIVFYEH